MSYIAVQIPELYPYVLYASGIASFECFVFGFFANRLRSRIFNKEYMVQFNSAHQTEMKSDAPVGGYPDMGNGYFSKKLSYHDWFVFQNERESYKDFVDSITTLVFCSLIAGLIASWLTTVFLWIHIASRLLKEYAVRRLRPDSRRGAVLYVIIAASQIGI